MSAVRPRFVIYICDNTERNTAFYIITKIRGIIPKEIYLNLQGVPAEFENATCRGDLPLEHVFQDPATPVSAIIRYMTETIQNNSAGMASSLVRFFVIPDNVQQNGYIQLLDTPDAIIGALAGLRVIQNQNTEDSLTIADRRQIVGVRFIYTPQPGGAVRTKETTVQDLKALCKKKGIRGYSRMKKAELLKALRSSR
jgi:hypothetical protein